MVSEKGVIRIYDGDGGSACADKAIPGESDFRKSSSFQSYFTPGFISGGLYQMMS